MGCFAAQRIRVYCLVLCSFTMLTVNSLGLEGSKAKWKGGLRFESNPMFCAKC